MSTRFWIGIVHTLVQPGIWTARSSSPPKPTSSSRRAQLDGELPGRAAGAAAWLLIDEFLARRPPANPATAAAWAKVQAFRAAPPRRASGSSHHHAPPAPNLDPVPAITDLERALAERFAPRIVLWRFARGPHGAHALDPLQLERQGIGELVVDLLRPSPRPLGEHDDLRFREVGDRVDRDPGRRPSAPDRDRQPHGDHQPSATNREFQDALDHSPAPGSLGEGACPRGSPGGA
jgi:hypothetical protein